MTMNVLLIRFVKREEILVKWRISWMMEKLFEILDDVKVGRRRWLKELQEFVQLFQ